MCAGFTVNAGGAVCSSLTRGVGGESLELRLNRGWNGTICLECVVWPASNPPTGTRWKHFFFFSPPLYVSQCFDIMSKLYVLLSNIWGAPLNQRDLTTRWANLHCVNTKWVIWKRCWHVGLCRKRKTNAFTYSVNAPVPCNVHPHIHSLSFPNEKKNKLKRGARAIRLRLGPWRNHYPHDPELLIPSLTPPSVSHFSHSLDKFIYMKDHSRWYRGGGARR